jgi:hypothetical protein
MARNDIRLDQINARLGDLNKPRERDYYDEDGNLEQFDGGDGGDDDGGSTVNAGFIATMVGLFLAVSGGTYMYSSGINPLSAGVNVSSLTAMVGLSSNYVSGSDARCNSGWREGYPNDTQLLCYLTQDIRRLCKPEERKHFVAVLSRYRSDKTAYDAKFAVSMFGMIGKAQTEGIMMGVAAAKMEHDMQNPNISDEKKMQQMDNVIGMGQDIMEGPNKLISERGAAVSQRKLVEGLRTLMSSGIMSKSDFGWFADDLVYPATKDLVVKGSVCT